MAQTKRKRRTKHRGNQAGQIESRGRTSRPSSRADARARAMQNRQSGRVQRASQPPNWRSASIRGGIAAGVLALILVLAKQPVGSVVFVSVLMLGIYIPLGYYTDQFLYRRRLRKDAEAKAKASDDS
ncbi:MAG: hypothetical protein ACRDKI_11365 [Solirubrobacterales bacterium]